MKKQLVYVALLISSLGIAQSINNYKAVIIPLRFEFMKSDNQYRLATLSKVNLNKAGFEAYYANEDNLLDANNRCDFMDYDVINEKGFLSTKLYVVFKDCYGKVVFKSEVGVSREKSFETAYNEALNKAFESIMALNYKYEGKAVSSKVVASGIEVRKEVVTETAVPTAKTVALADSKMLYAQPTTNGFQLIDSTPVVVMKVQRTSKADFFFAQKGNNNGVLFNKDTQWFFEYYQGELLMSEKVDVKF